jgi:hypothetical protein
MAKQTTRSVVIKEASKKDMLLKEKNTLRTALVADGIINDNNVKIAITAQMRAVTLNRW